MAILWDRWFMMSLALAAGCVLGAYAEWVYTIVGGIVFFVLSRFLPWHEVKKRIALLTVVCWVGCGYFLLYDHWHQSALLAYVPEGEEIQANVHGVIDSAVKRDGDVARFFVVISEAEFVDGRTDDFVPHVPDVQGVSGDSSDADAQYGYVKRELHERIALRVKLSEEEQISEVESWTAGSPFTTVLTLTRPQHARNPNAFDYANYLRWQGVALSGETSYKEMRVTASPWSVGAFFERWQTYEAEQIDRAFHEEVTRGYMKSLLLGLQDGVEPDLSNMYADLGLIHVLAISGLHITIVSGFILWGLERAGMTQERALLVSIALIAVYVLLVGASPSAVRSGLMGGIALWARYARKRVDILAIWGTSLIVMLLWNPYQLWGIGFQLSYVVTLGLILYVPLFQEMSFPRHERLRSELAVAVAAQLVSFPFLLYWFHQSSPLSMLVNLLLVSILSYGALPFGYLALILSHLQPALGLFPAKGVEWLLTLIHWGLEWVHTIRVPFTYWPHPHALWLLSYVIFLIFFWVAWHRGYQRRRDAAVYLVFYLVLLVFARQPFSGTNEVRVTFIDVGQGDSALVEIGKEKVYLIDGGGTPIFPKAEWQQRRDPFEVGKDTLLPFLKARGIEHIDTLVLTHGDNDHVGGIPAILPYFTFGRVLVNGLPPEEKEHEIIENLTKRKVPIVMGRPGSTWQDMEGVSWSWLHPSPQHLLGAGGNDSSIVLKLTAYGIHVLFTGDVEKSGEKSLWEAGLLSPIDILKVGHHGSNSSTTEDFLAAIRPRAAIISVGYRNRYHHPSPEVISRLERAGTDIYRTDQQGAVTIVMRDGGYRITTQIKK
ncbi:DNA internalization-related competence protein ComEC/Rec2 [Brevibacillus dissolubilis]|uniref:DNA internalization-related competence protein ComEC/Rec2 n=1 Tax=Brevibacillus dissolubilis TaxID=1844116 RepID=UPI0021000595|nr:DNA internalization-related competence protein ComEC/Rec2 [Brevibacillus dissolubilis]